MRRGGTKRLRLGRFSSPGVIYFLTSCCHAKRKMFLNRDCAKLMCSVFEEVRHETDDRYLAYVVMPDHIHWLLQLGHRRSLSEAVRLIKGRSARYIHTRTGIRGTVWQAGYYDRGVRADEDLVAAAKYLIYNPVRADLVETPEDYPYWFSKWHDRG